MRLPARAGVGRVGVRVPVAAAVALLFCASLCVGVATHVKQAALARQSNYAVTWRSSQAAIELGRVVERAAAALAGLDGVDADDVALRFDVLRNRIALLDLPEYAAFLLADREAAAAAADLRAAVAKAETLRAGLGAGDGLRAFRSALVPALGRASVLAGVAHRYGIDRAEEDRAGIATLYALFAGLAAATLLAVVALVVIAVRQARELEWLAHRDPLTGLANRAMLAHRLRSRGMPSPGVAVLCLDLDRFKPVNDRYGHAVGDAVLVAVARRIEAVTGAGDVVARVGGDEFVVVTADVEGATCLAARIVAALELPIAVDGRELRIGTSVGIAAAPVDGAGADDLLRAADAALYRAKRAKQAKQAKQAKGAEPDRRDRRQGADAAPAAGRAA